MDSPDNNYKKIITNLQVAYDAAVSERSRSKPEGWKTAERKSFLQALKNAECYSLLEVGAGHGRDSLYFARKSIQVTCIDVSTGMVAACQKKGLNAFQMNVLALEFQDDSFDAVYSLNSMLHIPDNLLCEALSQIKRVLKPGGLFYYGTYGGERSEGIWQDDHNVPRRFFNYYSDIELLSILSQYFDLKYFRQVEIENRKNFHFQSLILANTK
jgi:SAM-dependent methyltransferase